MNFKSIFTLKNLNSCLESFDKGMESFNKGLKDFGNSMDKITTEFSEDVEKSNRNSKSRAIKDKENLDKIWGKKD
jgi:hypothetical protein